MTTIHEHAQNINDYVVATRRYLHQYPEPSLKEYKTCAFIQDELKKHGIVYEQVGETGTLATIQGTKGEGKTVLLRADIDALEMDDLTGVEYASKNKGLNHSCGHDTHIAMGLGTAIILQQLRDTFTGTVKIAFQPAEEIGAGAKQFVASGKINDADEVYAIHIRSDLELGKIAVHSGPVNASCDIFKITVTGFSSHVGQPHIGRDALVAGSEIVGSLQTIVAREIDPLDNAVVGIGKFNAGTRYNIVASEAVLEGTIRAFSHETRAHLKEAVDRIAKSVALAHRCECTTEWYDAAAPVINSKEQSQAAIALFNQLEVVEEVVTDYEKSMGADDFADYLVHAPGAYILLGASSGVDTSYGHHHEKFNIDERALAIGVECEVACLLERLK